MKEIGKTLHERLETALRMEPGYDESTIVARSHALSKFLHATGWKIDFPKVRAILHPDLDRAYPLVEYVFGEDRYSLNSATDPDHIGKRVQETEGTSLSCESLQYFGKVSDIGERVLPTPWPSALVEDIVNPKKHLSALNEIWWLARWIFALPSLLHEAKLKVQDHSSPYRRKTVDWRFSLGERWMVNLEVKCFPRSHADRIYAKTPAFTVQMAWIQGVG